MHRLPHFSAQQGLARAARLWLLWLALALVAGHSAAIWHAYVHSPAEAAPHSPNEKHAGTDVCGICVAVAGIGGAAPGPSLPALHPPAQHAVPLLFTIGEQQTAPRRPYAIRAPPFLRT